MELPMRKLLAVACITLIVIAPSDAAPEHAAENIADVRCLAVGLRMAQLPDPSQKSAGMMATLYYIGRLDGRAPSLDLQDLIVQELLRMTGAAFQTEAVRCGTNLTARGKNLAELGEHLLKRGQALQSQQVPNAGQK